MSAPSSTARALAVHLGDIADVIDSISVETYRRTRDDRVSGSVGAHVRHVLDHVTALLEPASEGLVDYDSRRRQTLVEIHQPTAIAELRRLAFVLCLLRDADELRACRLSAVVSADGRRFETPTLFGRELVFVLSHTVHHQAIIALLLATEGRRTPARFGLAPSTPTLESCAQSA
jgi:uncharacterized damage-inducible protein DinB